MNPEIEQLCHQFVNDIEGAVKRAARTATEDAISMALGDSAKQRKPGGYLRLGGKGEKRSPEEIQATRQRVLQAIEKSPGINSEGLQEQLKLGANEIALAVKQLGNKLKWKGVARGRMYTAR